MDKSSKVLTPIGQVHFNKLWTPDERTKKDGSKQRIYGVSLAFQPEQVADLLPMLQLARAVRDEKWPNKPGPNYQSPLRVYCDPIPELIKKHLENFYLFRKANGQLPAPPKGQEGMIVINLKSYDRPVKPAHMVAGAVTDIEDHSLFYAGCYAVAKITAFAYDNETQGVQFGLDNILKLKDGEPISGAEKAEQAFKEIRLEDYGIDNSAMFGEGTAQPDLLLGV